LCLAIHAPDKSFSSSPLVLLITRNQTNPALGRCAAKLLMQTERKDMEKKSGRKTGNAAVALDWNATNGS